MSRREPGLPLEQRLQLFNEMLRLRRGGLSHRQIKERIHGFTGVRLHISQVYRWVDGTHKPLGNVNKFNGKPSTELAGVIGMLLSDGDRQLHSDYLVRFQVKDRDFAEAFGHDLAKVLGKKRSYEPFWSRSAQLWIVEGRSILFFRFLDRPWQKLKPYIEHCKDCVAAFLRAFFDVEGSIRGRELKLYNTNREILLYIKHLLRRYFGIVSTSPLPIGPKPGQRFRGINGKIYRHNKQCYQTYIPVKDLPNFHRYIGFKIKRKQRRLVEAIQK